MVLTKGWKARHLWQSSSFHSIISHRYHQAQHKQQPTVDHFVAPPRQSKAGHKWWLNLACIRASPKRLHNKYTQRPTSDHSSAPPTSSTSDTPKSANSTSTRAQAKQLFSLCGQSPHISLCAVFMAGPHRQSTRRAIPTTYIQTTIKAWLQKGVKNKKQTNKDLTQVTTLERLKKFFKNQINNITLYSKDLEKENKNKNKKQSLNF